MCWKSNNFIMNQCERVSSSQILGVLLLVFSWITVLIALILPDWSRSTMEYSSKDYQQALESYQSYEKDTMFSKYVYSSCPSCKAILNPPTPKPNEATIFTPIKNLGKATLEIADENVGTGQEISYSQSQQSLEDSNIWLQIGMRGLWKECAFFPLFPTWKNENTTGSYQAHTSSESLPQHHVQTDEIMLTSSNTKKAKRFPQTRTSKSVVAITPSIQYKHNLIAMTGLNKIKMCRPIPFERSSCLLLGIQAMLLFGVISGTLSVMLALVSVLADRTIRQRTQSHPFPKRFEHRNIFSVLSGVIACLSGTLVLTGCWWFTLEKNSAYFTPAYQHHHEKNNADFVPGTSLLTAVASGIIYLTGGFLLGVTLSGKPRMVCQLQVKKDRTRVKHTVC